MSSLTRKINIISRCSASYRTKHSSENLPGIYHSYVFAICNNPGLSQEKIAKRLCINKSNITRHFTFLEENGYIERKMSEKDKRETLVFPTQKMLDILPEITSITKEWNAKLTDEIDKEELEVFMKVLENISTKAREIIYDSGEAE